MNRRERNSFVAPTPEDIAYGEGACLETPPGVFQKLHERFHFDVDLTANEKNHLLPRWFGPRQAIGLPPYNLYLDALTMPTWMIMDATGFCRAGFSNPPYGPFIPKILTKALQERDKGFTSVFLLPMRAAKWYKDLVIPYYSDLWHLESRLTFPYLGKPRIDPNTKTNRARTAWNAHHPTKPQKELKADGALFDSIIVVYAPHDRMIRNAGLLFLHPEDKRPNIWNPKTGELRY